MATSRLCRKEFAAASVLVGLAGLSSLAMGQAAPAPAAGPPPRPQQGGADAALLDIVEFDVAGNTVLDEAAVDEAIYPFLGPRRTRDDIDHARAALEKAYVQRGYKTVSVGIPQQRIVAGAAVIHLQVVEGRVGHLKVVGSKYTSIVRLKEAVPALAEGNVPNFNDVQRSITTLNSQADRSVTPSLTASTTPGTFDVDLLVEDHLPLHGSVEVNNQYSQATTHLRTIGTLSYDNLFQRGHSLTLSYQAAPENESDARVAYASYLARFGASPFSLLIDAFHTGSNVSVQGGADVIGQGEVAEIKGIFTLASGAGSYQALTLGLAYKHFNDQTTIQSPNGASGFTVPITYVPFSVGYTLLLRNPSAVTQLDLTASFAIPGMGTASGFPGLDHPDETTGLNLNRFKANGQELFLRGSLTRTQELPLRFQGFLRLSGQIADAPLVTNEELTLGGANSVRGYLEAEALGDYGFSGSFELRSPQLARTLSFGSTHPLFQDLRLLAFVDGGRVYTRDALPGERPNVSMASYGAGGNLQMLRSLNAQLYWAKRIYEGPATPGGRSRFLFRVWASF